MNGMAHEGREHARITETYELRNAKGEVRGYCEAEYLPLPLAMREKFPGAKYVVERLMLRSGDASIDAKSLFTLPPHTVWVCDDGNGVDEVYQYGDNVVYFPKPTNQIALAVGFHEAGHAEAMYQDARFTDDGDSSDAKWLIGHNTMERLSITTQPEVFHALKSLPRRLGITLDEQALHDVAEAASAVAQSEDVLSREIASEEALAAWRVKKATLKQLLVLHREEIEKVYPMLRHVAERDASSRALRAFRDARRRGVDITEPIMQPDAKDVTFMESGIERMAQYGDSIVADHLRKQCATKEVSVTTYLNSALGYHKATSGNMRRRYGRDHIRRKTP